MGAGSTAPNGAELSACRAGFLGFRPVAGTIFGACFLGPLMVQDCDDGAGCRGVLWKQYPGPAGAGNELPGGGEEPVPPPFHVPPGGLVFVGQHGQLQPGDQVHGQCCDVGPCVIGVGVEERQFFRPGVL